MKLKAFYVFILLITHLNYDFIFCCSASFTNFNSFCYKAFKSIPLIFGYPLCNASGGHLITLNEVALLPPSAKTSVFSIASHKLFGGNLWFDLALGSVDPSVYGLEEVKSSTQDPNKLFMTYENGKIKAANISASTTAYCRDEAQKTVYPVRKSKINKFIINEWPAGKAPQNYANPLIDTASTIFKHTDRASCLLRCIQNRACKSAYHSSSKLYCVIKLLLDAPLGPRDSLIAKDFTRYTFDSMVKDHKTQSTTTKPTTTSAADGSASITNGFASTDGTWSVN